MLIPSMTYKTIRKKPSLSRRVNANSQLKAHDEHNDAKLIKKGEC